MGNCLYRFESGEMNMKTYIQCYKLPHYYYYYPCLTAMVCCSRKPASRSKRLIKNNLFAVCCLLFPRDCLLFAVSRRLFAAMIANWNLHKITASHNRFPTKNVSEFSFSSSAMVSDGAVQRIGNTFFSLTKVKVKIGRLMKVRTVGFRTSMATARCRKVM